MCTPLGQKTELKLTHLESVKRCQVFQAAIKLRTLRNVFAWIKEYNIDISVDHVMLVKVQNTVLGTSLNLLGIVFLKGIYTRSYIFRNHC